MKKFWRKIILSIVLFLSLPIGILIFMFSIDTTNSNSYLKAYSDKKSNLIKIENKHKIIFIGGSNVAFGLNSEEIKRKFKGYEVLNYGLHGGIGIKYLLNEVEDYLKEGDILIIIPEYENFYNEGLGEEALWEVVGIQKSLKSLDWTYLKRANKILIAFKNFININKVNNNYGKKFTYDRRGFNKNGDYIEHWKFKEQNTIISGVIQSEKLSKRFIEELEYKIKSFENRGIKVFLFPSVYQKSAYLLNKNKIFLIEKIMNRFDSKIDKFIYSNELFFDTVYHLNKEGVDKRTKQIIKYLEEKI